MNNSYYLKYINLFKLRIIYPGGGGEGERKENKKMNEGIMIYQGEEYISGPQLAAEYNIERTKNKKNKEKEDTQITPYVLDTLLEDSVKSQTVYSINSLNIYVEKMLDLDKGDIISKRLGKVIKKYKESGETAPAKKKKDKELREAPKKKMTPTEKIRSLVKQIEEREERNTRLNKRDREAIRKELKKLDKVGKMSLADLIYFPEE